MRGFCFCFSHRTVVGTLPAECFTVCCFDPCYIGSIAHKDHAVFIAKICSYDTNQANGAKAKAIAMKRTGKAAIGCRATKQVCDFPFG